MVIGGRSKFKVVSLVFWNADFFVYMDGHPQAMVVLFSCLLPKQGFKEATMGITSCVSCLFVCFVSCSTERSKRGECCINRSHTGRLGWLSYRLTGLALIWADGAGSDTG